jgi:Ca2+-binding EF-hand superfamily protein
MYKKQSIFEDTNYINALYELNKIINIRLNENRLDYDNEYYAKHIAKSFNIDAKQLVAMYGSTIIHNNLNEITNVAGYKPVGMHEFFKFMSNTSIPKIHKDRVVELSAKHVKEPYAGHDQEIKKIFDSYAINLDGIIPVKKMKVESVSSDILPKSGGGQEGTKELLQSYLKATPGEKLKKIKKYIAKK